jgi:hypothetical protein
MAGLTMSARHIGARLLRRIRPSLLRPLKRGRPRIDVFRGAGAKMLDAFLSSQVPSVLRAAVHPAAPG